jgi:NTE family protein
MMRRGLVLLFLICFLIGCGSGSVGRLMPWGDRRPRVALVLGGGAARGFAHVGVIRALEKSKIQIDMIVGANIGALIGAIYADKKGAAELERLAFSLEERDIFDYNFINPTLGFARGARLEDFLAKRLSVKEIDQLKLPFAAVATDIQNGEVVILQSGSIARAVHASSAIPGIFTPVAHQGKMLVDGGVLNNVPVDIARRMGADVVIAVDLGAGPKGAQVSNLFDNVVQSFYLAARPNAEAKLTQADVAIRPKVTETGLLDFSRKKELVTLGAEAAERVLPEIRKKLGGK